MLASPPRGSHILQIYDSEDFLSAAVAHFAAEGVKQGEAVLLTGSREHLAAIDARLRSLGVHAESGQLVRSDLQQALAGVPHSSVEEALASFTS